MSLQQITLPERMDGDAFEQFMRDEYFPAVDMSPTRAGQVTGLALFRGETKSQPDTNTFLLRVDFDFAERPLEVDEEVQRKFESFGPRVERVYSQVAYWPHEDYTPEGWGS
jgi:hypothetical protein